MPHHLINFTIKGDQRGSLIAAEQNHNVPFDIKRVYYIFDTAPNVVRGRHAHRTLEQIAICVSGSCDINVQEGGMRQTYHLDSPTTGLYIGGVVWREMQHFSPDAVLLVLASAYYDETDYIRDYQEFLQLDQQRKK